MEALIHAQEPKLRLQVVNALLKDQDISDWNLSTLVSWAIGSDPFNQDQNPARPTAWIADMLAMVRSQHGTSLFERMFQQIDPRQHDAIRVMLNTRDQVRPLLARVFARSPAFAQGAKDDANTAAKKADARTLLGQMLGFNT